LLEKLIFRVGVDTEKKWDKLQLVDTASNNPFPKTDRRDRISIEGNGKDSSKKLWNWWNNNVDKQEIGIKMEIEGIQSYNSS